MSLIPSFALHPRDPDTAVPDFGIPSREYIEFEAGLRTWWTVTDLRWETKRFTLVACVHCVEIFLGFVRLISANLNPMRSMNVVYLPCSDQSHNFALSIYWQFPEEAKTIENIISAAFWATPV